MSHEVMAPEVTSLELGVAILQLHRQLHRHIDQAMCTVGLSLARAKFLMRLSEDGPMNQASLAGALGLAPRTVTETVDGLERDGLVCRTDDLKDRRARIIELTPAGRDACASAFVVRLKTMDEIFGSLSADERLTLSSLLTSISANVPSGVTNCGE